MADKREGFNEVKVCKRCETPRKTKETCCSKCGDWEHKYIRMNLKTGEVIRDQVPSIPL